MDEFQTGYRRTVPFDEAGPPVRIDPDAYAAIEHELIDTMLRTGHESGGLLVGARGTRIIYEFLPSGGAATRSSASYTTDPEHLQSALDAAWARNGGDVIGYVHSHPFNFKHPSQQDLREAAAMVNDPDYRSMNAEVLIPIATVEADPSGGVDHTMHLRFFIFLRSGRLIEVGYELLPRQAAIADLEAEMAALGFTVKRFVVDEAGLALRLTAAWGRFVLVLPPSYPAADPEVLVEDAGGELRAVEGTDWFTDLQPPEAPEGDGARSEAEREAPGDPPVDAPREAHVEAVGPGAPSTVTGETGVAAGAVTESSTAEPCLADHAEADAPALRVLLTDRVATTIDAPMQVAGRRFGDTWVLGHGPDRCWVLPHGDGLRALLPEGAVGVEVIAVEADFDARSQGIVMPSHLGGRHVLIVGAGSVGSAVAEQLVRAGVRQLTVIDPDTVALSNLCRSVYAMHDIGRAKVDALADRLRAIHPHVSLTCHAVDVLTLDLGALSPDLAIVAVDRPEVIQVLDAEWHARLPAVYPGVYARGSGGEVLYTWPGSAPLSAVLDEVRFSGDAPPKVTRWDYSTDGRLAAEPALVAQIAHVVSITGMIALSLLSEGTQTAMATLVDRQFQGVFIGNDAGWLFEHPFQTLCVRFDVTAE